MAEAPAAAAAAGPTPEPATTEDVVIKPAVSELTPAELAEPDEARHRICIPYLILGLGSSCARIETKRRR